MVAGIAAIGAMVRFSIREKENPTITPAAEKKRLVKLTMTPGERLTLSEAEDGAVLARRYMNRKLESQFLKIAAQKKKGRRV
jgi:hypothetical protein